MSGIQKIYPLIIKNTAGEIVDVSLGNEKGFNKSLERGILWHLHSDTGRLLPYDESTGLIRISNMGRWYEAVIDKGELTGTEDVSKVMDEVPGGSSVPSVNEVFPGRDSLGFSFLEALEKLVYKRKSDMPEGSYTTHLFKSGAEKIRKKTGEEAVELILASERESIRYEAADLIYHLIVLLASEDISLESVVQELYRRFNQER